jgi:GH15 family glucan-1,4-alpha-glucosidase
MARRPNRTDGYLPIEDYGAIGDSRSLALVGLDGTIDWLCLPELDSPSTFAAILDPERGGRFVLQPDVPFAVERRYLERTNVLETTFETDQGRVRVTDALTIDKSQAAPWRELVRKVEGLAGSVPMRWRVEPRPDYGRSRVQIVRQEQATVIRSGRLQIALKGWDAGAGEIAGDAVFGRFDAAAGSEALLVLVATNGQPLPVPRRDAVQRRLAETLEVWRAWVVRHSYAGPWRDEVERSLLAIRLLADARTGAIAAAGTTSLPEALGGERNYDYRFGWVRDLCFTLDALLGVGLHELTQDSLGWLLGATSRTHPRVDPVYTLRGDVLRSQDELPLSGYRRTAPVHLGNGAGGQLQLGGFGDLLETVHAYVSAGHLLDPATGERLADIVDLLARIWRSEDSGLWELGERAHYGTSKLGVWIAFARVLELVELGHVPARHVERWRRARDDTREFIERDLFSQAKNSYLLKAGSDALDCGMLLAARRGFGGKEAIVGTIDALKRALHAGGALFYRYSGMQEAETAFLACSFWMVEAMALTGRLDEASELMDGVVGVASDLGLYSEEIEPDTHAMRGNFPQALTHLSLISAAHTIERAASPCAAAASSGAPAVAVSRG